MTGTRRKGDLQRQVPDQAAAAAGHRSHRSKPPVLLIDEIDRADEEFEGFLLEMLSDFQITIPELGTYQAENRPVVVVTSNRTREVHDALKRRCLYLLDRLPGLPQGTPDCKGQGARAVPEALGRSHRIRAGPARRASSSRYRASLNAGLDRRARRAGTRHELDPSIVDDTLGIVLKYREDIEAVRGEPVRHILNVCTTAKGRRGRRR